MGSFNMTSHSGVTHEGDKCVLFFVIPSHDDNEVYGLYKPISGPIFCSYADYGNYRLDDSSQVALNDFISFVKPQLLELALGENQYHDIPANPDLLTWDYIHDLCHENRLFLEAKEHYPATRIQRFVVHKSYFDSVINEFSYENWRDEGRIDFLQFKDKFKNDLQTDMLALSLNPFQSRTKVDSYLSMLDTQSYNFSFFRSIFSELLKFPISQEQFDYSSQAWWFIHFMRSAQFDFFPCNYAGQERHDAEMLFHTKLLKNSILYSYATDWSHYLFEQFDEDEEFPRAEYDRLTEKWSGADTNVIVNDPEFILLSEKALLKLGN